MVSADSRANAPLSGPDFALSLLHPLIFVMIPNVKRCHVTSLWQLDYVLAQQIRTVREPHLQVMRLLWWQQQLTAIAEGEASPAHPLLQSLADMFDRDTVHRLGRLPEIWSDFIEAEPLRIGDIEKFAAARGRLLFTETASLLEDAKLDRDHLARAGAYWSIVDVAAHLSDQKLRTDMLQGLGSPPSSRGLPKALAALTLLSVMRGRHQGEIKPFTEQLRLLRFSLFRT